MEKRAISGSGVPDDALAKMKERLDTLEAENARLKETGGGIRFDFHKTGDAIGKTGNVRKADSMTVSGGEIGFPVTHTMTKWPSIVGPKNAAEILSRCKAGK